MFSNGFQAILLYGLVGNAAGVFSLTVAVRRFKARNQSMIWYNLYSFLLPNLFIISTAARVAWIEQTDVTFFNFVFLNF